jgi:hypothetical protein
MDRRRIPVQFGKFLQPPQREDNSRVEGGPCWPRFVICRRCRASRFRAQSASWARASRKDSFSRLSVLLSGAADPPRSAGAGGGRVGRDHRLARRGLIDAAVLGRWLGGAPITPGPCSVPAAPAVDEEVVNVERRQAPAEEMTGDERGPAWWPRRAAADDQSRAASSKSRRPGSGWGRAGSLMGRRWGDSQRQRAWLGAHPARRRPE